jgi:putative aminopeptidase FrvX
LTINYFYSPLNLLLVKHLRDEVGNKNFGNRVKKIRLDIKMTQEAVALEAGIEPMHLN